MKWKVNTIFISVKSLYPYFVQSGETSQDLLLSQGLRSRRNSFLEDSENSLEKTTRKRVISMQGCLERMLTLRKTRSPGKSINEDEPCFLAAWAMLNPRLFQSKCPQGRGVAVFRVGGRQDMTVRQIDKKPRVVFLWCGFVVGTESVCLFSAALRAFLVLDLRNWAHACVILLSPRNNARGQGCTDTGEGSGSPLLCRCTPSLTRQGWQAGA